MANVIVATASFTIEADSPANLSTSAAPPVTLPIPPLVVSGALMKGTKQEAAVKADMEGQAPMLSIPYCTSTHGNLLSVPPGIAGVLSWDGKLLESSISSILTKGGKGVVLDDVTEGTVKFTVVTPAQDTSPTLSFGSPIPDPKPSYNGKWKLVSNPNTKLTASS